MCEMHKDTHESLYFVFSIPSCVVSGLLKVFCLCRPCWQGNVHCADGYKGRMFEA